MAVHLRLPVSAVLLLAAPALAIDYTWTNPAGGSFAGNFTPGGTPTPAADTVLVFPDLFAPQAGYTALNNLGSFTLNAIRFETNGSPNPAATTVQAGAAAGFTLRFAANGTTQPSIQVNGNGMARIENGTATVGVTLTDGTNLVVGGTGLGSFELAAVVRDAAGGSAGITFNHAGPFTFGAGPTMTLSGVNAYSAGTSIVRGNVVVAANGAFGSGPVTIDGTEHSLTVTGSASAVANALVLNQSLRIAPFANVTFSGAVSGPGGMTFEVPSSNGLNTSAPATTFTGPATATGPLNIGDSRGYRLAVVFAGASGTTRYSSFAVGSTSVLTFDNTSATAIRVNAPVPPPLTLRSGTVKILGQSTSANVASETFGLLTASGYSSVTATPGPSSTATLRFAGLTRELNATLDFSGTNLGSSGNNTANFVFTADPGGTVGGILPYAVAATSVTASSRTLARYDTATGRVVPLNVATDYNPVDLYAAGQSSPGANFRRAGTTAAPNAGSAAGLVGAVAANAIVLEGTSLAGSATLTVASGTLVQSGSSGYVNLGGLNFGATPAYLHGLADQIVNAPIFGSGGVVKSGAGTLTLTKANSFSGGLTINAGTVSFASDAALGAPGGGVTLNVADVSDSDANAGLVFGQNPVDPSPATTLTTTRPIAVGPVGGNLNSAIPNGTWTIVGPISGSGPLRIGRGPYGTNGVVTLTGTNSNTGRLNVEGTLAVASDAVLGAPGSALYVGGQLRVDGSFTTARPVDFSGTVVLPSGQSLQLDGPVTGTFLTVVGGGELAVTSASLFKGGVAVGALNSSLTLLAALPAGVPSGATLTLRGPNGAMPLVGAASGGSFQLSQAGVLYLDNSGPVGNANSNRIGGSRILLSGGELNLTGNAAVGVTEVVGSLTSDRYLGIVTLSQPDSRGAGRQTALVATGYSKGTNATLRDVLFVRGTNLGATAGDRTALTLNSDPLPVNGLIEAVVVATSPTGSPTDFAAATPVGTQFAITPFTAYAGPVPASGGSPSATYDNTGVSAVTGNIAANALRLSAGGGVQMNVGMTVTLGTGMILALPGNAGISGGTLSTTEPLRVVNAGDLTIGTAAGPTTVLANNGFVKAGAGRLTLFGTASTTLGTVTLNRSTVTVAEGTLALGNAQALVNSNVNGVAGALPDFWVDARGTLDLSALPGPVRVRALYGYGSVRLGPATLQIGDAQSEFGGSLVGPATATFMIGTPQSQAAGNTFGAEVRLVGDNSGFAGGFTVLRGTLALWGNRSAGSGTSPIVLGDTAGNGQANLSLGPGLSFTRDIIVTAGATPSSPHSLFGGGGIAQTAAGVAAIQTIPGNITLGQTLQLVGVSINNSYPTCFFTGTISGPGALQQATMNTIFTGDNTFSGGFTAGYFGVVGLGSNSTATTGPLGTGPVRLGTTGGTFLAYGGPRTLSNPVSTTGTAATFLVTGLNDLTFAGSFNYSTLTQPLQLTSQSIGVTTFAGPVIGAQRVDKNGSGTVVFANPVGNPYTGGTIVNAGTLIAANTSGSATGTSAVAVNNGAILGGTGIVGGATTVAGGGVLRGGANETTAGTLTVTGNVTMQTQSIVSVTLNGSSGGKLQLAGGFFDLTGATMLTVFVTGTPPATAQSYTIVDSGAIPIAFFNGFFNASNFAVSASFPFTALTVSNPTPTTLVLNYTPVPEPTGVLAVAAVAAGMAWRVGGRREKRAAQR